MLLSNWRECTVHSDGTLRSAIATMDSGKAGIVLILDDHDHLLGVLTDGDVRRAMLRGEDLLAPVAAVMNQKFVSVDSGSARSLIRSRMREFGIRQIPIISNENTVEGIFVTSEPWGTVTLPNPVLIMAGGKGQRLAPLTVNTPKPMLTVADRPILQLLVERFVDSGFRELYISLHHLGDQIKAYFGDGKSFGCNIEYLEESEPLDTAGAISLVPGPLKYPIVVTNGDLLTDVDYRDILVAHESDARVATQCVYPYEYQVPFGIVREEAGRVVGSEEKPIFRWMINAGIYVLSPEMTELVPKGKAVSMPDLLETGRTHIGDVATYELTGRWLDIGDIDNYRWAADNWTTDVPEQDQ
jgi:UDP-2,4-diacetamido-2,4,6-trideoxy-beta-L-gulopyranose hydrolase